MQNSYENKVFLLDQIDEFLGRFPIGAINRDMLIKQNIIVILKFYIQLLQDCAIEK